MSHSEKNSKSTFVNLDEDITHMHERSDKTSHWLLSYLTLTTER